MNRWDSIILLEQEQPEERQGETIVKDLVDERTRQTLVWLQRQDANSVSVTDVADGVAGEVAMNEETVVNKEQRQKLLVYLYHSTLPKLDQHGYLAFDPQEQTVSEITIPDEVTKFLRATER